MTFLPLKGQNGRHKFSVDSVFLLVHSVLPSPIVLGLASTFTHGYA